MRSVFLSVQHVRTKFLSWSILVIALALLVVTLFAHDSQAAQVRPSLVIDAPTHVEAGYPISLVLTVHDVEDIGGYELTLLYDTSVVELRGLHQRDNDLTAFGRGTEPLSSERVDGLAMGLYSCPFADCVHPAPGSPRQPGGGYGTLRLADVALVTSHLGTIEVKLIDAKFVTADGSPIDIAIPAAPLLIEVGPAGSGPRYPAPTPAAQPAPQPTTAPPGPFDLTGDGVVTYADAVTAAVDWTTMRRRGLVCLPDRQSADDVNHDSCLDIGDIQMIANHYSDLTDGLTITPPPPATPTVSATEVPVTTPISIASPTITVTDAATPTPNPSGDAYYSFLPYILSSRVALGAPTETPTIETTATLEPANTPSASVTPTAAAMPTDTPTIAASSTITPTDTPTPP